MSPHGVPRTLGVILFLVICSQTTKRSVPSITQTFLIAAIDPKLLHSSSAAAFDWNIYYFNHDLLIESILLCLWAAFGPCQLPLTRRLSSFPGVPTALTAPAACTPFLPGPPVFLLRSPMTRPKLR